MAAELMPDQSSAATEHAILQEITRPLEALPDDPLSVINADFPTTLRGYERVAVEDYVRRTRQLVAELQATRSPEAAVRRALERVGEEITGILQRAHETAEQITLQSRSDAEDRLEQARREAAQIAGAAEQRVRELDADTDRIWLERQRIVADAEELAAQLLALAKTASARFPADGGTDGAAGDRRLRRGRGCPGAGVVCRPRTTTTRTTRRQPTTTPSPTSPATGRPVGHAEADDVEETVAFQPLTPLGGHAGCGRGVGRGRRPDGGPLRRAGGPDRRARRPGTSQRQHVGRRDSGDPTGVAGREPRLSQ